MYTRHDFMYIQPSQLAIVLYLHLHGHLVVALSLIYITLLVVWCGRNSFIFCRRSYRLSCELTMACSLFMKDCHIFLHISATCIFYAVLVTIFFIILLPLRVLHFADTAVTLYLDLKCVLKITRCLEPRTEPRI